MKNIGIILTIIVLTASGLSCAKKIVPGLDPGKMNDTYDKAAYEYIFVEAVKQKVLGNPGDALKYFEQCIEKNPGSDAAYYQMAQIVLGIGDLKAGKRYAGKALEIQPQNLWYLMMMAGLHYQEKNIDSAIIFYERAVKFFPEKEELKMTLANLYSENQKFDKARAIFNSFDEKYGVNETTTASLVRNLIAEKKFREALEKTQQLLKQFPDEIVYNGLLAEIYRMQGESGKALEVYNNLIERNPDNPGIQLALVEFLVKEKSYNEVMGLLNKIVISERIPRDEKIQLFAGLLELDELIKQHGITLESTLVVFESQYKDDEVVVLLRPELFQKEGKLNDAAIRLEEIVKLQDENYFAWEKLLLVYYELRDFQKLFIRGEDCATKYNRSFLAKVLYATAATELEKYEIALEELRKANILAGDNKELLLQVVTMKADIYYRMKDFQNSFSLFEEALLLNSDDLTILNNYAYYLAEQSLKLKEAEDMAKKVIEREKDNTTFLDTYAWVLYKRGKLREAAKVMESIINSDDDDDAEWYEHYGFILKEQGKCEQAIEKWEIAVKIDSSKINLKDEIKNCRE